SQLQACLQKAYRAMRSGDHLEAMRWAGEAARLDANSEEAYLLLASAASTPQASVEFLKRALQINPTSSRARKGMLWAVQRLRAGQAAEAVDAKSVKAIQPSVQVTVQPRPVHPAGSLQPGPAVAAKRSQYSQPKPAPEPSKRRSTSTNWPLILGAILVFSIFLLSATGPRIAPNDPNKENYIFILGPRDFLRPPVPAFTLPGYPFGTDEFGRDIFSRLLHAIGPTMNLVVVVAAIRLVIGTIVGLISGWNRNWFEKLLDALTSGAIAIPVIFVALFAIASAGQRMGIAAFIIGLSLTGWAETARIIREQTRVIKSQVYIEASQALGASGAQSLRRHVLPQVMPLIWILLPLEASSALLTTAALGFLGYFANVIWIPIGDWTSLRSSGVPDLGEMLALSAKGAQFQPWSMLAAGIVVFIAVLGFNLLGDGLRIQFAPGARRRNSRFNTTFSRLQNWLEERWFDPLSPVRQNAPTILAVGFLVLVLAVGGFTLYQAQARENLQSNITIPGGHLWASSAHDAQNTIWVNTDAPTNPKAIWKYITDKPVAGGPVVAADGTLYLTLIPDQLLALSSEGQKLWQTTIPYHQGLEGVVSPAIGPNGDIYVVGMNGSLTAVSPQGEIIWSILQDISVYQVLTDPIIDSLGNIYYATDPKLYAITPKGEILWQEDLPTYSYTEPSLTISGNEKYLIFEDTVLDITNGRILIKSTMELMDKYVVGTDGEIYTVTNKSFDKLVFQTDKIILESIAAWDPRPFSLDFNIQRTAGRLPSGYIWIDFGSVYNAPKIVWIDPNGIALTPLDLPYQPSRIVLGIDRNNIIIVCGGMSQKGISNYIGECRANAPGETRSLWKFNLDEGDAFPVGGALIPGRMYVAAYKTLYALGDE
ncbi:MAG TPA: ABC transporter permease subunit, partial [Anaerolineaceae bacterium]|nr:ABC transporter permease subunit [Anaerolineaceae bacterium]